MPGTIIDNLSGRKLAVFVIFLFLCQLTCFLIGGLVAPMPTNSQMILGTVCKDTTSVKNDTTKWFYNRGRGSCKTISLGETHHDLTETDIVFAFQMPVPRDYSRWQQNLIGVLQVDIKYHSLIEVQPRSTITIDARLAYRNKGDPEDKWTLYTQATEKRHLDCEIEVKSEEYHAIPLFELGSLFHDYYLLNVRLPVDTPGMNSHIGPIQDMWITIINQNGDFTKVWLSLKTVFFPCIITILVWFWRRIHKLSRKPVFLEKMLLSVGVALSFLNLPIEYLTLYFDLPFMLLLNDIRQGVFYATLFLFWIVFAGERMLINDESSQSSAKQYWGHFGGVTMGCGLLLLFDIYKRGPQVSNPFKSIWATDFSTYLALTFIIPAGISAGAYLLLLYKTQQVYSNISHKTNSLATTTMYSVGRLQSEGIIFRFKVIIIATLICAAFTVIEFILGQIARGQWTWGANIELNYTSAFFTGVYGMWNIYIFALVVLYAPSDIHFVYIGQNLPQSI